jgi:hypothetical protein
MHNAGDEVTNTLLRDFRVQATVKWDAARVVRIDRGLYEPQTHGQ